MLHPVGDLSAAVYWRRRLMVLTLLVGVLGGGGWLGYHVVSRRTASSGALAAPSAPRTVPGTPALERVVPSLASVQTPAVAAATAAATSAPVVPAAATTPLPVAGGPCSDAMLSVQVHAPTAVAVGSTPTFDLVITNTSAVPCVRPLDRSLQEIVLVDTMGNRVWGSDDCYPGTSTDSRTLEAGEVVSFPVGWRGTTSEPTCTAPRLPVAAGVCALRGRLDTLIAPDVPLSLY